MIATARRPASVRRKLMRMILLTSAAVFVTTSVGLFSFDIVQERRRLMANLTAIGRITAANSTAALAFASPEDAGETLSALRAEEHILAAVIYERDGRLFASYRRDPDSASAVPAAPGNDGQRFEDERAVASVPIAERGGPRLGTLYLESDLTEIQRRTWLLLLVLGAVAAISLLLAYVISRALQLEVSRPILALADTARAIADRHDYSVRAPAGGEGEIGLLTLAFNRMLTQIHEQDQALRRSEARFRRLADSNIIGVVTADDQGRIVEANDAFLALVGRTRETLVASGIKWSEITAHGSVQVHGRILEQLREHGISTPWELEVVRPEGARVPILLGAATLEESAEGLDYVGYVLDLTAQKHAEQRIRGYALELERSNSDLQQFAYVASHDLQEPLRMVASYTELLGRRYGDKLDDTGREFIAYASGGARRMQGLIVGLLDYSRVNTRGEPPTLVDMNDVLDGALQNLRASIAESGARITSTALPSIVADSSQMTQLLQNLIGNAIRFRGPRAPLIQVEAQERENDWLFRVRDNGIGIDSKHFERIFMIFQRLHRQDQIAGTGIGLALCKRIVVRHRGELWVESTPDIGSVFSFTIPKQPPAD